MKIETGHMVLATFDTSQALFELREPLEDARSPLVYFGLRPLLVVVIPLPARSSDAFSVLLTPFFCTHAISEYQTHDLGLETLKQAPQESNSADMTFGASSLYPAAEAYIYQTGIVPIW